MKRQLSSLDLHFLLKELKALEGSRMGRIYQPEKNALVFSFYKTNAGKKILKIYAGQSICLIEEKEDYGETLGFGMLLRKHLNGYFLYDIAQIEPERIIRLSFKAKDDKKHLYLEFFGKGNAILCNEHNVIINALEHHEFRERVVKPKLRYVYPIMNYNLFGIDEDQLKELLKNSKKESIVVSLAVELGLGGIYSEEICLLSGIDKGKGPCAIENNEIGKILKNIEKLKNKKIEAQAVFQGSDLVDAAPFAFEFYKNNEKKYFPTFSRALEFFYSQFKEVKETKFDKRMKELQRVIGQQKAAIEELKTQEKDFREKGELIYHRYSLVREVLDEISKASEKYSWKEIKEKLKGHKIVKEINEKERKIAVEIE